MDDVAGLIRSLKISLGDKVVGKQRIEVGGEASIDLSGTDVVVNRLGWSCQREGTRNQVERLTQL